MSFELKLTIKSQAELNELIAAIDCHLDIQSDMSIEIVNDDSTVDKKEFNETITSLIAITRLKERLLCLSHLGTQLPKKLI